MPGFLEITAEDISVMRDGGGGRFTAFMDSLIRATAGKLGIPPASINTTVRVSIADGGVDTEVGCDGRDPAGRLTPATAWQYKATEYSGISDAVIEKEVGKSYARKLIEKGYGYRLCICDDPPAATKAEKLNALRAAVRAIRADAPDPQVLIISDLVAWANQYTAVVAKCRRIATTEFLFFDSWAGQATAVMPRFVGTAGASTVAKAIEEHVDWSHRPPEIALTIYGEAGVGKTRSVYEAIASQKNNRELVIYTRDEAVARKIAVGLANDADANAVLIADECLPASLHAIQETLGGTEGRIRLITIDNAQERRSLNPQLELSKLSQVEVEGVLAANFPNVAADNRRRYAHLSSGFLRIAADMCRRDQEIRARGDIAPALETIAQYYETRIDRDDRAAVEALSLVDRAGYLLDVAGELDELCRLVDLSRNDVAARLERIRIAPGFIVNAGRYYYVTPAAIAIIAFQIAWDRWVQADSDGFLRRLPESLLLPFQRRVSRSASPEVSVVVAGFFRRRTESLGAGALGTESEARRLLALIETDPSTFVPILRRAVDAWFSLNQAPLPQRNRRQVIWIAERAAIFPDFFPDVEHILFVLACHETEPAIGNNATKTWQSLFSILLSGTSVPVHERIPILARRLEVGGAETKLLVIGAIRMALQNRNVKLLGPPMFGRRVPPEEWRPTTQAEYRASLSAYFTLLVSVLADSDSSVRKAAEDAFLTESAFITRNGGLDLVAAALRAKEVREDFRARLLSKISDALEGAKRYANRDWELDEKTREWVTSLRPTTLHGRIIEEVSAEPWSHRYDKPEWRDRLEVLARELVADDAGFEAELEWLNSAEARASAEFGNAVGKHDSAKLSRANQVLASALKFRSHAFARGYVYAVCQDPSADLAVLNRELDAVQAAEPELALFIAMPGGDETRAFERGLDGVRGGKLRPGMLRNMTVWVGSRKTSRTECKEAVELLLQITERDRSEEAAATAIEFISYRIHGIKEHDVALKELSETFDDDSLASVWKLLRLSVQLPSRESFWIVEILKVIAQANPGTTCLLVAEMLVSEEYSYVDSAETLISELATAYPKELMKAVGRLMLSDVRFYVGKFDFLGTMPVEAVAEWLREVGVEGARPLARHLIAPSVDEDGHPVLNPLTEFVLREFEGDDRTFREFVAGTHSFQTYVGSYATARTREASVAKAFLNHPLRRVREWASIELEQAEHDARISSIEEEEMNLE